MFTLLVGLRKIMFKHWSYMIRLRRIVVSCGTQRTLLREDYKINLFCLISITFICVGNDRGRAVFKTTAAMVLL